MKRHIDTRKIMRKTMTNFDDYWAKQMEDPEFRKGVEELEPEYAIIRQLIQARKELGLTQSELAQRTGIRQCNLSRLETGHGNPSLAFLKKVATGLGKKLVFTFQ